MPVEPAPAALSPSDGRVMVAGLAGNVLEWYDFALYGFLSPITSELFFPAADPLTSIIQNSVVFGIGFLVRPLGGLLLGRLGDRIGRRALLTVSVAGMAVPTFLIGLLPTHASIGVWAPVLLALLRLAQGFSAGGEFTGSIVYLVEQAPRHRRGFFGSLANVGAMIGGLLGAAIGWLTTVLLSDAAMHAWGWRLPFLTSLIVGVIGFLLRRHIPEAPVEPESRTGSETVSFGKALRGAWRPMVLTTGLNWVASAGYYVVFVWFATDLTQIVGLPYRTALGIGTLGLLVGLVATVAMGWVSDQIGARRLLAWGSGATAVLSVPLLMLAATGTAPAALAAQLGLAVLVAIFLGALPAVFVVLYGTATRCTALSFGYNVALALFGGSAPLVATLLIHGSGWTPAPGLYLAATALVCGALVPFIPKRSAEAETVLASASHASHASLA